jgi:hypothetical protein
VALVTAQPYVLTRLADETASRAEFRVHIQAGSAAAAALGAAAQLAELAGAASSCTPVEYLVRYPVRVVGEAAPAPGARVALAGLLVFETSAPGQYGLVEIPGVLAALVAPDDSGLLDVTAPALAALVAHITSGLYSNPWGYTLTACIGGLLQQRR